MKPAAPVTIAVGNLLTVTLASNFGCSSSGYRAADENSDQTRESLSLLLKVDTP
jgi:hypothetical protein